MQVGGGGHPKRDKLTPIKRTLEGQQKNEPIPILDSSHTKTYVSSTVRIGFASQLRQTVDGQSIGVTQLSEAKNLKLKNSYFFLKA